VPTLRTYQQEDFNGVLAAHQTHQSVIGQAATGMGKAVLLAALAEHYSKSGTVLILVDVRKLVRQLADTVMWYTGVRPGVEMGDERAVLSGQLLDEDKIIVGTVQTMYSGPEGYERYRKLDPSKISALLLDECELFLAPKARAVVEYLLAANPNIRAFGCTATPHRTDGIGIVNVFPRCAFQRDILWGIDEGWLVPARQAFVRVNLDFSTLKLRKDEDGEADYSDADIAERINNEQTLIELAKGIIHAAEDRKSIVVCPDVATAKAVEHYLDAERPGCARCVYGEMDDLAKDDVMDAHQRGDFQFLTSVMMLTKGYDDRTIRAVFNCRKTRSRRLYTQILGRGTRPNCEGLEDAADADARRALIATSGKPDMLMVNLVGIAESVRDVTLIDVLGEAQDQAVADRAKQIALERGLDTDDAIAAAEEELADEREVERLRAEMAQDELDRQDRDEAERRIRRLVQVDADVQVEYQDDLNVRAGQVGVEHRIPPNQLSLLRKAKVPEADIAGLDQRQAARLCRELVRRWKVGLCSYRQAKLLMKHGYSCDELRSMSFASAGEAITELKENNWRRPEVTA
jgi:superfamily II DNA or RNA helicase